MSKTPSNYRSESGGDDYLKKYGIVGIEGIDVRALTKKLRDGGVLMGIITTEHSREDGLRVLAAAPEYDSGTYAREVSTRRAYSLAQRH